MDVGCKKLVSCKLVNSEYLKVKVHTFLFKQNSCTLKNQLTICSSNCNILGYKCKNRINQAVNVNNLGVLMHIT